jgi:hypothetical protein
MLKTEATTIINPVSNIGIGESSVSAADLAHAPQRLTPLQSVRQPRLTARWSRTQGGRLETRWLLVLEEAA